MTKRLSFNNRLFNRHVVLSVVVSIILVFLGYFTNNWPLFTGEDLNIYTRMEILRNFFDSKDDDFSGAFFVNTSMDKQLINVYEDGYQVGKTEITDRRKLLEFLKLLEQTEYEYLVIDLRFAEELACQDSAGLEIDRQLAEQIKSMDRCVVATHRNINLFGGLETKAALADYKSTVTATNFVRYEYFDNIPSIPLHVYNEINKSQKLDTINYHNSTSLLSTYDEGGWPCQNSLFLEFSSKGFPQLKKIQTEIGDSIFIEKYNYRNLGFDFVDHLDNGKLPKEEIIEMLQNNLKEAGNGKRPIVFIGNILEDLHDTYAGLQPGVIILYKAICALQEGRHIVNPFRMLTLFVIYFLVCLFILKDKTIVYLLPKKLNNKFPFFMFLLQLANLSIILFIIDIIDIKIYGVTTNFIFVTLFFNLLKLYIQFKKFKHNETLN